MATDILHHALNVGVVDRESLHRVDLARMRLAAEQQTNILCDAVGRGFLRPGTGYIGATEGNAKARLLPFVAGNSDAYVLELTPNNMRIVNGESDAYASSIAVNSVVNKGAFDAAGTWSLASTSGQTSTISGGFLNLTARAHGGLASATQAVSTTDTASIHTLKIVVDRGPVQFRVGTASGGDQLVKETTLRTGTHFISFIPGQATYYIKFLSDAPVLRRVASCEIVAADQITVATNWDADDIEILQATQSLDVMFVACSGKKQQRIERRGDYSWSVCDYQVDDGPFLSGRTSKVTLTPSACEGNITLTASEAFFESTHVGALFKIYHNSVRIDTYLAGDDQYTPTFMVTGITETNFEERKYTYTISGTWAGTIRNYRSFDGEDIEFHQYRREQASAVIDITANASYTNDDNDDNAITWVKIGFGASSYTSGEARIVVTYDGGGGYGIGRVTAVASSTSASVEVLTPFKGITASEDWQESAWSDLRGWPSAVGIYGGRLFWVGDDAVWGSISDAYESFDEEFDGDAGPLFRAIALGGYNEGRWILPLKALMVGCDSRVATVRASSLEEILTPSNFNVTSIDKVPCAPASPAELKNDRGLFISNSRTNLYELNYTNEASAYLATKFSQLTNSLFSGGLLHLAVQNFPDQRVWATVTDSAAVAILYEPSIEVVASVPIATATGDVIESIACIPGTPHDRVYMSVRRVVNGSTVRYVEKMALESESRPATITKCVDSYVVFGAGSAIISGLSHLEGRTVVAWADGDAVNNTGTTTTATFTVTGGQITLPFVPVTGGVVGLPYRGRFKSARLSYGAGGQTPFLKKKTLASVGLILADYCRSGVKFGWAFDDVNHPLRSMPVYDERGTVATEVITGTKADEQPNPVGGDLSFDSRLCIELNSPKPCSILAIVMGVDG